MKLFKRQSINTLEVDIHSHLIPNIDDGSKSIEQTLEMIISFQKLGYKKIITTPHIHPSYPNTPETIISGLNKVKEAVEQSEINIQIEAAAEYFVDEKFLSTIEKNENILSFGENLVLVESSFINKPIFFEQALFELKSKGYTPVLAHPERYQFLEGSIDWLLELKNMGVLLQVTLGSISGYYGETPQKISKQLLKADMVDFLGSDLHKISQIQFLKKGLKLKETHSYMKRSLCRNSALL